MKLWCPIRWHYEDPNILLKPWVTEKTNKKKSCISHTHKYLRVHNSQNVALISFTFTPCERVSCSDSHERTKFLTITGGCYYTNLVKASPYTGPKCSNFSNCAFISCSILQLRMWIIALMLCDIYCSSVMFGHPLMHGDNSKARWKEMVELLIQNRQ